MRWSRAIAAGLAVALAAIALSAGLVTADDCNRPAPDDFRSDVAWDGQGLHHQSQDVQDLFSSVWGTDDDLHVRTWAWQHNCRTRPPDDAASPTDGSTTTGDQGNDGSSSSQSGGGPPTTDDRDTGRSSSSQSGGGPPTPSESGDILATGDLLQNCGGKSRPTLSWEEIFSGVYFSCNTSTGEWVRATREIPGVHYATDDQLVAPSVGNCGGGFTHYDPIREECVTYPDGPDV